MLAQLQKTAELRHFGSIHLSISRRPTFPCDFSCLLYCYTVEWTGQLMAHSSVYIKCWTCAQMAMRAIWHPDTFHSYTHWNIYLPFTKLQCRTKRKIKVTNLDERLHGTSYCIWQHILCSLRPLHFYSCSKHPVFSRERTTSEVCVYHLHSIFVYHANQILSQKMCQGRQAMRVWLCSNALRTRWVLRSQQYMISPVLTWLYTEFAVGCWKKLLQHSIFYLVWISYRSCLLESHKLKPTDTPLLSRDISTFSLAKKCHFYIYCVIYVAQIH